METPATLCFVASSGATGSVFSVVRLQVVENVMINSSVWCDCWKGTVLTASQSRVLFKSAVIKRTAWT